MNVNTVSVKVNNRFVQLIRLIKGQKTVCQQTVDSQLKV